MELNSLLDCPSCKYTEQQHIENMKRWGSGSHWDKFKPIVYRDRLFGEWVVVCQNCGMAILFNQPTEEGNIDLWNELPREIELKQ
jgi:hypothetical protein